MIINSKNLKEIEEDGRLLRSQLSSYVISVFAIDWEKGRQRCKKNEFYNQPYEVKEEVEKMVPVTEWIPVKQGIHKINVYYFR